MMQLRHGSSVVSRLPCYSHDYSSLTKYICVLDMLQLSCVAKATPSNKAQQHNGLFPHSKGLAAALLTQNAQHCITFFAPSKCHIIYNA